MKSAPAFAFRIYLVVAMTCLLAASAGSAELGVAQYGVGSWPETGHGSHRALVRVAEPAEAVWVHIPWRRRDSDPEAKAILVEDLATGERVINVVCAAVTREMGDIVFKPATVPGDYGVYYLPYNPGKGYFGDAGTYFTPEDTADPAWVESNRLSAEGIREGTWRTLPKAELVEIQARNEFNRFDPMEVAATGDEVTALVDKHPSASYLLFPEDRLYPVRMADDLPYRWIERGPSTSFIGEAQPNEFYTFQLGVFAARTAMPDLALQFGDLTGAEGRVIPASAFTCFNLNGTDWLGRPIEKTFDVGKGKVRPLWIGVQIPRDAAGDYTGSVSVQPEGAPATEVAIRLTVKGPALEDRGDSDLWRMSRLRWLNSPLGIDEDVIPPFTPLKVDGPVTGCIGRLVTFGDLGLPESVTGNGRELLARPVTFSVETAGGEMAWEKPESRVLNVTPASVERESHASAQSLNVATRSRMEFDGCITYETTLTATEACDISDIHLDVPFRRDAVPYMMGMSKLGGYRPAEWRWKWDIERIDNMVWLGDVPAGLQLKLTGPEEVWLAVTLKATGIPESWGNDGKGGCDILEDGDEVVVRAYTGARRLEAGETLVFHYRFLATPFKPIDPNHWNWRYGALNGGGNIAHIHQGDPRNPYINYPFLAVDKLTSYVKEARSIQTAERDPGSLSYPAQGHLTLEQGALHAWVTVNFDPQAGEARNSAFNQNFARVTFPNQDEIGFYWNVDDRGMRAYVRKGAPGQNQYPIVLSSHSPEWRQGDRHAITLSWGDEMAVFVDGRRVAAAPFKGTLADDVEGARLEFRGKGFSLDAVKVSDMPFAEGAGLEPVADGHTLLLDAFSSWTGGPVTAPDMGAPGAVGTMTGVCKSSPGRIGNRVTFSSNVVETPPPGVNIYYTVRELTNHVVEMWALRSLGDEIFETGEHLIYTAEKGVVVSGGDGYPWLKEHLVSGYIPAWRQPLGDGETDAAIATKGLSRWHNYYIEGMDWLMKNTGVDGLYLDGIGYDREIMKRIAKVMARNNPAYRINFHSGNDYAYEDRRVSPANKYMEHLPYMSNLWFGEMYDYNLPPDYWLVEVSGIPFGLTSEMLNYQNGGNAYRGMIYGMTGRLHPSARAMWRFWDDFGIQDADMIGYWDPGCPVRTERDDILATVYRKPDKALIALAGWTLEVTRKSASARPVQTPPAIDGSLAPGEWDAGALLTAFTEYEHDRTASDQTEVFVTYDAENLYVGFRCAKQAGPLKADATERDGTVWEDDAIEIFIQPSIENGRYVQFVGNSRGVFYDGEGRNADWNGPWRYQATVHDTDWQGEIAIPFEALGISQPADGTTIGLNVCRDQQTPVGVLSSWARPSGSFHEVAGFGRLTLSASSPSSRDTIEAGRGTRGTRLAVNWQALGIDKSKARFEAPAIDHFQGTASFGVDDVIPVEPGGGWLLVVTEE